MSSGDEQHRGPLDPAKSATREALDARSAYKEASRVDLPRLFQGGEPMSRRCDIQIAKVIAPESDARNE